MKKKVRRATASDFSVELRGNVLILRYHDRKLMESNIRLWGLVDSNMNALEDESAYAEVESVFKDIQLNEQEVQEFVHTFEQLIYKYSRMSRNYKRHGKFWSHFEKATATCKRMGMTPTAYLTAVISGYSNIASNSGATIEIPWPAQLHGETAEEMVTKQAARQGTVPMDGVAGRKEAALNRNLPIDKDEKYNRIKRNISNGGKYSLDDLEYAATRQVQAYGRRAKWIETYTKRLAGDKEAKQKATGKDT